MGALVQQHSTVGAAQASCTETFSPAVAGHLLVIVAVTNENAGADNITTPSGWTLLGTFRQGTIDVNIAVFGKIAVGGETSQLVQAGVAQRLQTWFGEFSGYSLTPDGAISTAGASSSVSQGDTGTVTPSAAGRLYLGVVAVKNSEASLTEVGGFTAATVSNESPGVTSAQKLTVGVFYDLARSAAAREQATWSTIAARYGGLGLLLTQASGLIACAFSSTGTGASTFVGTRIGPADATISVNRGSILLSASLLELHGYHVQNSIRGKPNGNGSHNARALAAAIVACNQVFDGHASHTGGPAGSMFQTQDPTPYGGYTVGAQGGGSTLAVDDGTHFPAAGSGALVARVYDTRAGTTFTFTGVSGNTLTGCSGLPGSIPAGSVVLLFSFTNNGTSNGVDRPLLFDNNQSLSVKELFDAMTSSTRTLALCGASIWMHGQASMFFPPKAANMKAWAYGQAEIAAQFAANGTPISDVDVWVEWKNMNLNPSAGQGGSGVLQDGTSGVWAPGDAGAPAAVDAHYGAAGYGWITYALLYNAVWDAFKNHPNAAVNSIRVIGPHIAFGGYADASDNHLYPLGSFDGSLQASGFYNGAHVPASAFDRNKLCYFLDYSPGFDGLTLDYSVVDYNDAADAGEAFVYAHFDSFRHVVRQVRSVLANRSGLSAGKRAAPIHFVEYYADVNLARVSFQTVPSGGGFSDLQQGYMEGAILRCMLEEGVSRAYRWQPMGDGQTPLLNMHSYFLHTQVPDAGVTRDSRAIAGDPAPATLPGDVLPAWRAAKIMRDNFPVGSRVHPTSCSDASGKLWAAASSKRTVIANGYSTSKTVIVEGALQTVPAYSLVAVDAQVGELIGAVPV